MSVPTPNDPSTFEELFANVARVYRQLVEQLVQGQALDKIAGHGGGRMIPGEFDAYVKVPGYDISFPLPREALAVHEFGPMVAPIRAMNVAAVLGLVDELYDAAADLYEYCHNRELPEGLSLPDLQEPDDGQAGRPDLGA